ncbi:MAG: choice-of-anchor V domain-containing protein [Bacteroidia bacterium]
MKKIILFSSALCAIAVASVLQSPDAHSRSAGAPAQHAGAPADNSGQTCAKSGCHNTNPATDRDGMLSSNVPETGYIPGETYSITVSVEQAGISKFGFQATAQDEAGNLQGSYIFTNPTETQHPTIGSASVLTKYITHTSAGNTTSTPGSKSWSFDWVAPAAGAGDVNFYCAVNCANGNGNTGGDQIFKDVLTLQESISTSMNVSTAEDILSVFPNPNSGHLVQVVIDKNAVVIVYDANGKRVMQTSMNKGNNSIDVSDLEPGVYFMSFEQNGVRQVKRFLRQ